ncbi:MAG: thiamine phosphate synthase [Magnetococcales bacterium]|nr:thiamine phosphate synthase [Magnetococcales bacterium]
MKPPLPRLLLITDRTVCPELPQAVAAALEGGVRHLLLREKALAPTPFKQLAHQMLALTAAHGAHLLIHDRLDIALAVGAAGLHLSANGIPTAEARQGLASLPGGGVLGRSCHSVEAACAALQAGADFVTLSPLFPTRSHPGMPALGSAAFASMRARIPGAVLALGGIQLDNVAAALATGATGVALIRGILDRADPRQAAVDLLAKLNEYRV